MASTNNVKTSSNEDITVSSAARPTNVYPAQSRAPPHQYPTPYPVIILGELVNFVEDQKDTLALVQLLLNISKNFMEDYEGVPNLEVLITKLEKIQYTPANTSLIQIREMHCELHLINRELQPMIRDILIGLTRLPHIYFNNRY